MGLVLGQVDRASTDAITDEGGIHTTIPAHSTLIASCSLVIRNSNGTEAIRP